MNKPLMHCGSCFAFAPYVQLATSEEANRLIEMQKVHIPHDGRYVKVEVRAHKRRNNKPK